MGERKREEKEERRGTVHRLRKRVYATVRKKTSGELMVQLVPDHSGTHVWSTPTERLGTHLALLVLFGFLARLRLALFRLGDQELERGSQGGQPLVS